MRVQSYEWARAISFEVARKSNLNGFAGSISIDLKSGWEGIEDVIGFGGDDAGDPYNSKVGICDPLLADFTRLFGLVQIFRLLRRKDDVRRYSELKGYKFVFQSLGAFGVDEHFQRAQRDGWAAIDNGNSKSVPAAGIVRCAKSAEGVGVGGIGFAGNAPGLNELARLTWGLISLDHVGQLLWLSGKKLKDSVLDPAKQLIDFFDTGSRIQKLDRLHSREVVFLRIKPVANWFCVAQDGQRVLVKHGQVVEPH
jgi:hypothetical protein